MTLVLILAGLAACGNEVTATSVVLPSSPIAQTQPSPTTVAATTIVPITIAPSPTTAAATSTAPTTAATPTAIAAGQVVIVPIRPFHSTILNNDRQVDIYLPPDYNTSATRYKVLYVNDGDIAYNNLDINKVLGQLYADKQLEKIIVVGIYSTSLRASEYGVAGMPNFAGEGSKADLYSKFVIEELLPYMKKNYRVQEGPANTAFMGVSLGGLMAFDLGWQHPDLFGKVGVFSGAFWVRTDNGSPTARQNSRILHKVVRESQKREGLKMWFSVGTREVTDDRDGNGVNDVIQDTTELLDELKAKGYQIGTNIIYTQIEGGTHDPKTWSKVLPDFLKWAFPG